MKVMGGRARRLQSKMKEKEKSTSGFGKVMPLILQTGVKSPLLKKGVLLSLSLSPAQLRVKNSPCCWRLKDFEDQGMFWLFPSWPSKRPQACLAQSSGAAKSWRSSAIFCPSGQSSFCQTSVPQAVSLGVLQEYPPCSAPDLCNNHVWCHHCPPKSSERNWLLPGSPPSTLHGFSCPPLNRDGEETSQRPVLLGLLLISSPFWST